METPIDTNSPIDLSVSVVVFHPDIALLTATIEDLVAGIAHCRTAVGLGRCDLILVDNTPSASPRTWLGERWLQQLVSRAGLHLTVHAGHGNIGYGRGHNLALGNVRSTYHLVLNPDVGQSPDALQNAITYLQNHREVGLLTPSIVHADGKTAYLCRQAPNLVDLFLRGFCPASVARLFQSRLARYEMRDRVDRNQPFLDPPVVSGCFMFFRSEVFVALGGFDPAYFLYFEDYDLSVRARAVAHIAYVPAVRITHHGGGASRKGWRHIHSFMRSAFTYFQKFGWRLT
jgi:GT2 family glycosyltransferase